MAKSDKKNEKKWIWFVLFLTCMSLVIAGSVALLFQRRNEKEADQAFEELQNQVNTEVFQQEETQEDTTEAADVVDTAEDMLLANGIEIPQKQLDWEELHEECEDIYAWIYVPDTDVDYPILQHPTDDSYYLNYNMDGTKGFPGCIYTEKITSKDFSDVHTVIYGHNLKSGLMFTSLHNFEDEELFSKDHYIFIYTEDYVYVYEIFAAYEYSNLHLLINFDFDNEYVYQDFLDSIYEAKGRVANVKTDIEVTTEDQIVTLSTCTKDSNEKYRYLVTGVLLNPRQEERKQ
ncbi:MAG: class B sortase [Lachnospiraceae bacterium]